MSVYVAASSSELPRAKAMIAALRAAGITVTSTWPEVIDSYGGVGNPRDLDREVCKQLAVNCLVEITRARVLWLLCPAEGGGTARGAYFELAGAFGSNKTIIASGDYRQSIFTALATECHETDEAALAQLVALRDVIAASHRACTIIGKRADGRPCARCQTCCPAPQ